MIVDREPLTDLNDKLLGHSCCLEMDDREWFAANFKEEQLPENAIGVDRHYDKWNRRVLVRWFEPVESGNVATSD